ncbi:alpha-glycosidase [Brevibacillus dissolubilis]|uniref:alpha-glycosidase n=1 Tax=Brevibacillus dissolubilis TaxID=1844116 RepID=UPI0011160A66|nr:alpha-glycosidase [Brevibacillus dissolubilis]
MQREAIYHRPKANYAYAYDDLTLHIRVRTKKHEMQSVELLWGDKYDWDATHQITLMDKLATDPLFDYWQAAIQPKTRRTRYGFGFTPEKGKQLWMTERQFCNEMPGDPNQLFDFPYLHASDRLNIPDWARDAVFYQIFPERFANGDPSISPAEAAEWDGIPRWDNFYGGDLAGIIKHLDHLSELGINALYLTPVFEATTNHKYDTVDYKKIDPHFGDIDTLKQLVKACHDRGIRVVLDAVFNHCGYHYPPFQDVLAHGEQSRYKDWFYIHDFPIVTGPRPNYECFGFHDQMPKFNTQHPEVKEALLDVARYWIEEADIDGWRLDVANEVDHEFWRDFRKVVKSAKPDALIIGEIWHDSMPWLEGDQFDTVMNYPFNDAVHAFIAKGTIKSAQAFGETLSQVLAMYPSHVTEAMFNLLDSHDTPRLLTACQNDKRKMKLATLIMLTYPGMPCIYYGDEVGMTGGQDPGCRQAMVWERAEQDRELFGFYQALIRLRHQLAPLRRGEMKTVYAAPKQMGFLYTRTYQGETVYVAVNNGKKPVTIPLTETPGKTLINQLQLDQSGESGANVTVGSDGTAHIELAPYGYAIYTVE